MEHPTRIRDCLLWLAVIALAAWTLISWDSATTANHRLDKLNTHNHFYFPAAVEPEIYVLGQSDYEIRWKEGEEINVD